MKASLESGGIIYIIATNYKLNLGEVRQMQNGLNHAEEKISACIKNVCLAIYISPLRANGEILEVGGGVNIDRSSVI